MSTTPCLTIICQWMLQIQMIQTARTTPAMKAGLPREECLVATISEKAGDCNSLECTAVVKSSCKVHRAVWASTAWASARNSTTRKDHSERLQKTSSLQN